MSRRAGVRRMAKAMKKAWIQRRLRRCQGRARKALLSTPRVKKR
jgi:hypothetical protein